MRLAELAF